MSEPRAASDQAFGAPGRRRFFTTGSTGPVIRDPNFYPFLIGNVLSNIGTWFRTLAQAILIYRLTHSTVILGVLGFSQYAAVFLLAPITGSVADRFDRRLVLMASQLGATVVTAGLTVITALGWARAWNVLVFALVLGVSNAFATPTMMAFVPSLVGRDVLSTALALNSASFNVGRAVGPVVAAVTIHTLGLAWSFGINSVSYLALVGGLLVVRPLTAHTRPASRPKLRESIGILLDDKRLAGLLLAILAMNLATDPPLTLGPAFVTRVFHHVDSLTGLLVGGFGAGAVFAAFTFAHRLRGTRLTLMWTLAATGAGVAFFAWAPTLPLAMAGLFLLGVGYVASNTAATSRLQLAVADEHRGRIMALWSIAFLGARPLGSLVDGTLASWCGLRLASFAMALPALAGSAVLFAIGLQAQRSRSAAQ